ncbi:Hypothetical predicted protein [Paramuricea clavata]|uniref:Pentraxin (PTX) domain-containing protein n=1 Tax=Paramuricea clavata TaxID=317549 RepID=A0A6S7FTD7_PARCT|nr:Hypothetical predicted protein [Paramuricea clavata]
MWIHVTLVPANGEALATVSLLHGDANVHFRLLDQDVQKVRMRLIIVQARMKVRLLWVMNRRGAKAKSNCFYRYANRNVFVIPYSFFLVHNRYQFDLDGTGDHPYVIMNDRDYSAFTANFWFKTAEKNVSYLVYGTADNHKIKERLIVWRADNIFFVELWKDSVRLVGQLLVYQSVVNQLGNKGTIVLQELTTQTPQCNFTFPTSYPVNDNNWHVATMVLGRNAELSFYLDGVMRDSPKLTEGEPNRNDLYRWSTGEIHLGYFKDSNGEEHFFNGSIAHFDIDAQTSDYDYIRDKMVLPCPPRFEGRLLKAKWARLIDLARPVTCSSRVPLMGLPAHLFYSTSTFKWLETEVSPPRHLTAFTIIFDLSFSKDMFPTKPIQIACYGDQGSPCRLSIVIHVNVTLEIIIESTRFDVDLIPLFNGVHFIMVLTWTSNGGVFELLINGVLHSRIRDIETNGQITGQSRFIIGGSDVKSRNFAGYFHYFNVWDKVLSEDMLYLMNLQPGIDMGNVVAWKDFKKPQEQFEIHERNTGSTYRRNPFAVNNFFLEFKNASAYSRIPISCCSSQTAVTLTMWLKIITFLPSTLFTFKRTREEPEDMVLRVKAHGEIMLAMDINTNLEEVSLGNISTINSWNFIAFTWDTSGELHCNINGKHEQISSNYKQGYIFVTRGKASWTIGDKNNTFVGMVAQVNWWFQVVPPPALMALSKEITSLSNGWTSFLSQNRHVGQVVRGYPTMYYTPDFVCQNKRDKLCDSLNNAEGGCNKYYARLGMTSDGWKKFACFCEDQLSKDMNFNYGFGNYEYHDNIMAIKPNY